MPIIEAPYFDRINGCSIFCVFYTSFPSRLIVLFRIGFAAFVCSRAFSLLWLIAFLSEIRVYAARKFFTDKMDPDRPRDVMYLKSMLKKNPNSWLTEFINFTWLYGLQACIKQSFKFIFYT